MSVTNQNPCQNKRYYVAKDTHSVACPPPEERIWDAHPRVYLSLNEDGQVTCPYCGTEFIVKNDQ